MSEETLGELKRRVRSIASLYPDRELRARRLFIEERSAAFSANQASEREFKLKTELSTFYRIPYTAISFCGSAQLGFSVYKDQIFQSQTSDLDAACVSGEIFQRAWVDVITSTSAFYDYSVFSSWQKGQIEQFKDQILRRGMIRVEMMPGSTLSRDWRGFQESLSLEYTDLFKKVTVAIYMNEYAFCWKQDSAISQIMGVS